MTINLYILLCLVFVGVILWMEIKEQNQKRSDENRIKAPTPDARAAQPCEMVVKNPGHDPKAWKELHNLAICDKLFPLGTYP